MKLISQAWNNFKTQPDIWFFYGFLATFTLSIRKVLFFYPIDTQFNEWTGAYLYLSDILIALTLISWVIVILHNNKVILSIAFAKLWLKKAYINLPLILVLWSFASILWSDSQDIALFRVIKLFEFYSLYLYIIFRITLRLTRETIFRRIFQIIITLGFIQAIIGIWQFIIQHSIGLLWLKESLISPNINGVARIVFNGEKYIRVYGLFPHPNILGGFLLISIILTWTYGKMFHPSRNEIVSRETISSYGASVKHFSSCHSERIRQLAEKSKNLIITIMSKLYPSTTCLANRRALGIILLSIQIIALILTFSKSAIIGLLIAMCYILWKNKKMFHPGRNVPPRKECSTPEGMFHMEHPTGQAWNIIRGKREASYGTSVEHFIKIILTDIIILLLGLYLLGLNFGDNLNKSFSDRIDQWNVSRGTIVNHFLTGLGQGQYITNLLNVPHGTLEPWQYQPIHNVFLLILAELGFVGLFIFALFLWKLRGNSPFAKGGLRGIFINPSPALPFEKGECNVLHGTSIFKGILLGYIFIMIFDHYLWDIQQGQIMLWLILGFLAGFQLQHQFHQSNPK